MFFTFPDELVYPMAEGESWRDAPAIDADPAAHREVPAHAGDRRQPEDRRGYTCSAEYCAFREVFQIGAGVHDGMTTAQLANRESRWRSGKMPSLRPELETVSGGTGWAGTDACVRSRVGAQPAQNHRFVEWLCRIFQGEPER